MTTEQKIERIFDGLRKVAFYVGHGKYNDHMSLEEVQVLKAKLEKIIDIEKEYEKVSRQEEKEAIYSRLSKYETYTVKEFIELNIEEI